MGQLLQGLGKKDKDRKDKGFWGRERELTWSLLNA